MHRPSARRGKSAPHPELVYLSTKPSHRLFWAAGWISCINGASLDPMCRGRQNATAPQLGIRMGAAPALICWRLNRTLWGAGVKDDRCVVVATRTELDWAMKNGQTSVWAPSKDPWFGTASITPSVSHAMPVALAAWFAASFDRQRCLGVGASLPPAKSVGAVCAPCGGSKTRL